MDCNDCGKQKEVSWAYVELLNNGHKATIWKLWVALLVLIVALVGTNAYWIRLWQGYDVVDVEYEQDGRGINIIGDLNDTEQEQIYGTEIAD